MFIHVMLFDISSASYSTFLLNLCTRFLISLKKVTRDTTNGKHVLQGGQCKWAALLNSDVAHRWTSPIVSSCLAPSPELKQVSINDATAPCRSLAHNCADPVEPWHYNQGITSEQAHRRCCCQDVQSKGQTAFSSPHRPFTTSSIAEGSGLETNQPHKLLHCRPAPQQQVRWTVELW